MKWYKPEEKDRSSSAVGEVYPVTFQFNGTLNAESAGGSASFEDSHVIAVSGNCFAQDA